MSLLATQRYTSIRLTDNTASDKDECNKHHRPNTILVVKELHIEERARSDSKDGKIPGSCFDAEDWYAL